MILLGNVNPPLRLQAPTWWFYSHTFWLDNKMPKVIGDFSLSVTNHERRLDMYVCASHMHMYACTRVRSVWMQISFIRPSTIMFWKTHTTIWISLFVFKAILWTRVDDIDLRCRIVHLNLETFDEKFLETAKHLPIVCLKLPKHLPVAFRKLPKVVCNNRRELKL